MKRRNFRSPTERRIEALEERLEQEAEIYAEYSGLCVYCSAPATTLDHVVAIARGGPHTKDNLVPACKSCNSSKHDKPLIVWMATRRREAA